jgi:hypothetical protein
MGGKYKNGSSSNWMERGVDWIGLAQDSERWQAVVNTVM